LIGLVEARVFEIMPAQFDVRNAQQRNFHLLFDTACRTREKAGNWDFAMSGRNSPVPPKPVRPKPSPGLRPPSPIGWERAGVRAQLIPWCYCQVAPATSGQVPGAERQAAGEIRTTNSPLRARVAVIASNSAGVPRRNSSNFFVSSRASTTVRSGNTSFNSPSSLSTRYGDS
jgi:hypothetical protein